MQAWARRQGARGVESPQEEFKDQKPLVLRTINYYKRFAFSGGSFTHNTPQAPNLPKLWLINYYYLIKLDIIIWQKLFFRLHFSSNFLLT